MSGIAGILADRPLSRGQLASLERVARTFPRSGTGERKHLFTAHAQPVSPRLALVDLTPGHQAPSAAECALRIAADAAIRDIGPGHGAHVELRAAGTHRGGAVLLQTVEQYGVKGLARINGVFAAALHDATEDTLTLVRDHLGIRPLYYCRAAGFVAFASQIRMLLPLLPNAPQPIPEAIAAFLENDFLGGENTALSGIRSVPPGCALVFRSDLQMIRVEYWSATATPGAPFDLPEAEERFDALVGQVMDGYARRTSPGETRGLLLSGGVDSSLLCALLARMRGAPIRTYSLGYTVERRRNELDSAGEVSRRFGTNHTAIEVAPAQLLRRLPFVVWATDELMNDHASLPTSFLAGRAASDVPELFSGEGGDEVFAGYGRHRRHPLQRWAKSLLVPGSGGYHTGSLWSRSMMKTVFGTELQQHAGYFRQAKTRAWQAGHHSWSTLQKAQYSDLTLTIPDNLIVKVGRNLGAFGVQPHLPWLDYRIVEFGLSLPDALKIRGRTRKYFLRHWGQKFLPHEQLFASKKGFHLPVAHLLSEIARPLTAVLPGLPVIERWFRGDAVRALVHALAATGRHDSAVWALLYLALWHRIFVTDHGRPPPLEIDPVEYLQDEKS